MKSESVNRGELMSNVGPCTEFLHRHREKTHILRCIATG